MMPLTDYIFDRQLLARCSWTGHSRTPGQPKFGFGNFTYVHKMLLMLMRLYEPSYSEAKLIGYLKKKLVQYGKRRLEALEKQQSMKKRSRLSQPKNRPLSGKAKRTKEIRNRFPNCGGTELFGKYAYDEDGNLLLLGNNNDNSSLTNNDDVDELLPSTETTHSFIVEQSGEVKILSQPSAIFSDGRTTAVQSSVLVESKPANRNDEPIIPQSAVPEEVVATSIPIENTVTSDMTTPLFDVSALLNTSQEIRMIDSSNDVADRQVGNGEENDEPDSNSNGGCSDDVTDAEVGEEEELYESNSSGGSCDDSDIDGSDIQVNNNRLNARDDIMIYSHIQFSSPQSHIDTLESLLKLKHVFKKKVIVPKRSGSKFTESDLMSDDTTTKKQKVVKTKGAMKIVKKK